MVGMNKKIIKNIIIIILIIICIFIYKQMDKEENIEIARQSNINYINL